MYNYFVKSGAAEDKVESLTHNFPSLFFVMFI